MKLNIIAENGFSPEYGSALAAGADLKACIKDKVLLKPGTIHLIPTGVKMAIPPGYEVQIRPRSGLAAKHGISLVNSPGTIDADYRGEIKIIMINHGSEDFEISRGMRIAQLVIAPVIRAEFISVEDLDITERGEGGFGSTGH